MIEEIQDEQVEEQATDPTDSSQNTASGQVEMSIDQNTPQKDLNQTTPKDAPIIQKKCKTLPLVVTEVRRSERIREKLKEFKGSTCTEINCFSCSADPPCFPARVIKSLGVEFRKVGKTKLSDKNLSKKRKTKTAIGAGKTTGKPKKDSQEDSKNKRSNEDKNAKKPKKK
ncbi:hypothetical protein PR202_gb12457 [Eleusine coracana subsp. coracana]|uniref:Uncharacterized protein n=1 Tax=Eleusine coracana subsp. coracana TaxID=191504 RepID=A0AAV5EQG2_ELECO|nr:hypothetical protein PR202_gb12457 [Eleusine coracana subsp. coracana]